MPGFLVTSDQVEVCPLSRGVMLPLSATPILPITGRPSLSPPSATRRPIGSSYGSLSQADKHPSGDLRAYHVPCKYHTAWVRSRLSAGGAPSAIGELGAPIPDPSPFGPSLLALLAHASTFGLFSSTTFIGGSHMLTIPRYPSPRPPWCWQSQRPLTISLPSLAFSPAVLNWQVRDTHVPRASHPTVTGDACLGRIPLAEQWVTSRLCGCNKYLHDFVSHPNA